MCGVVRPDPRREMENWKFLEKRWAAVSNGDKGTESWGILDEGRRHVGSTQL